MSADALMFPSPFDSARSTAVPELDQSVTPSSSSSTLPPPEPEHRNMGWIDFGGLDSFSAAPSFDPMLMSAAAAAVHHPLHHPHAAQHHHHSPVHMVDDTNEHALLSSMHGFSSLFPASYRHTSPHHSTGTSPGHTHSLSPATASPPTTAHPVSSAVKLPSGSHAAHAVKQEQLAAHAVKQEQLAAHAVKQEQLAASIAAAAAAAAAAAPNPPAAGTNPTPAGILAGLPASSSAALPTDLSLLFPPAQTAIFWSDDDKWQAVMTRDPAADAAFVYCVTSTRIYCRPTCASRRPLRANTVYADTPAEAEVLGYRACRRCLPHCLASASEMRQVLAVEQAKVVIHDCVRDGRPAPSLSVLAQHVGMSKFHLQRTFKRLVGHSPDAHAKALAKAWRGVGRG